MKFYYLSKENLKYIEGLAKTLKLFVANPNPSLRMGGKVVHSVKEYKKVHMKYIIKNL